jgi:hypothetical protein
MFWAKVFNTRHDLVVAICDRGLIRRKLGVARISRHFYADRLIDEDIAVKLMRRATIGNLTGSKIVSLAERNGFISAENVIQIGGIPHAQFVRLRF